MDDRSNIKNQVWSTSLAWAITGVLATLPFLACNYEKSASRLSVQVEQLRELERIAYDGRHLQDGPAIHAFDENDRFPLYPYYLGENGDLVNLVARVSAGEIDNLLACIVAPAGFGKSPLIDYLRRRVFKDAVFIDLKEVASGLEKGEKKPDLIVQRGLETLSLNELPYFSAKSQIATSVRSTAEILLIDSVDEVHPDTATELLDEMDTDVQSARAQGRRRCVFIFGRAEGFGDYLLRSKNQLRTTLYLTSPEWRSVGDLQNLFKSAVSYRNREYSDEVFQRLDRAARTVPHLLDSMRSLSLAVFLVEREYSSPAAEAGDIKGAIYRTILSRSSVTHGRPKVGSQYGGLYQELLRAVAQKYAYLVEIDPKDSRFGYFEASSRDVVHLKTGESASVWAVLDRSGLVECKPMDMATRQYRFAPLWLQRYLLEEAVSP